MSESIPKKPICDKCGVRDSCVVCGKHRLFLCLPCSALHMTRECFFTAAPAAFLVNRGSQLELKL